MGLRINTNVQSLVAQNRLSQTREKLEQTQGRLASGSRIVQPQDDAAGLAISENLRSDIRVTGQNIRNAQSGHFLLQTAEGALNEMTNIIIRMKELAVQAASDTNGDKERSYLDNEVQTLKSEVDRISAATSFNGRPLLTGEGGELAIQVGRMNVDDVDRFVISADLEVTTGTLGISGVDLTGADSARDALDPLSEALDHIAQARGAIGAGESRLNTSMNALTQYEESISKAYSQIRDADVALETANFAKYNILSQAGVALLAQANASPQLALKLLG